MVKICRKCGKQFSLEDYLKDYSGDLEKIKEILPSLLQNNQAWEVLGNHCPGCLGSLGLNDSHSNFTQRIPIWQENQNNNPLLNINISTLQEEVNKKSIFFFSRLLVIISICIFGYSLAFKFLPLSLPTFPFYPYLIALSCFIFIIWFKKIIPLHLVIVLSNFTSPAFRNIFFSYFDKPIWIIIWSILFILSNISTLVLITSFVGERHFIQSKLSSNQSIEKVKGSYRLLYLSFILYFGLVSPFHLKVIKPKVLTGIKTEIQIDKLYTETIHEVDKEVDQQIAYQYLKEGKISASKGTRTGFMESVQSYQKAIELIPNFSTAYAEMAYSYASVARISSWADIKSEERETNFNNAKKAIEKAELIGPNNPTVWSIGAILDTYRKDKKSALTKLKKAEELAKDNGFSDRLLQARALLGKKYEEKLGSLMTVNEKISLNNAELYNLLGVLYYNINDKTLAKNMFERAITLSPNYGEAYLNLALVSPANKRIPLWKEAAIKDKDLELTANNYILLLQIQQWLRRSYLILLILFLIAIFRTLGKYVDQNDPYRPNPEYSRALGWLFLRFVSPFLMALSLYYGVYYILFILKNISLLPTSLFIFYIFMLVLFVRWAAVNARGKLFYVLGLFSITLAVFMIYKICTHFYPISINTMSHRFPSLLFPFS